MSQRLIVTITDELAQRITVLADLANVDAPAMAIQLLLAGAELAEDIADEDACEQIAWLAAVEPQGRA